MFVIACHEHIAGTLDGGFSDFLTHVNGERIKRWPHHRREGQDLSVFKDEHLQLYWQDPSRPKSAQSQRVCCIVTVNAMASSSGYRGCADGL